MWKNVGLLSVMLLLAGCVPRLSNNEITGEVDPVVSPILTSVVIKLNENRMGYLNITYTPESGLPATRIPIFISKVDSYGTDITITTANDNKSYEFQHTPLFSRSLDYVCMSCTQLVKNGMGPVFWRFKVLVFLRLHHQ